MNYIILLNIINHVPYLYLFIIRSILFRSYGTGNRSFYYEKNLLKILYNDHIINNYVNHVTKFNNILVKPYIMYYYQLLEGIFHSIIVFFGLIYLVNNNLFIKKIFEIGLYGEIMIMDSIYFICFNYIHIKAQNDIKKISFLTTLVHHITIIPNIIYLL